MRVDFRGALEARLAPYNIQLSSDLTEKLESFYTLLARWNLRVNLTALPLAGFPSSTLDRLFVEPLIAAEHLKNSTRSLMDLGSGGGSPAVPLALAIPGVSLLMVESRERKVSFLREAIRQLALQNAAVFAERFSELLTAEVMSPPDTLTLRAVRIDDEVLEVVRRWLKPGGQVLLFGGDESLPQREFHSTGTVRLPGPTNRLTFWTRD